MSSFLARDLNVQQFGRGAAVGPGMVGRNLVSPLIGNAAGMLGPGSVAAGVMARGSGMVLGHTAQRGVVAGGYGQQYGQQALRLASARGDDDTSRQYSSTNLMDGYNLVSKSTIGGRRAAHLVVMIVADSESV